MPIDIKVLSNEAAQAIEACSNLEELENIKIKYLSRKGLMSQAFSAISNLPEPERPAYGKSVNELKDKITQLLENKSQQFKIQAAKKETPTDVTLSGANYTFGRAHILTQVIESISEIFIKMGFSSVEGPEIETEFNNFTGLNIPLEHPSREAFDTFYLKLASVPVSQCASLKKTGKQANRQTGKLLLRSHTSPVQIRAMSKYKPPLAVIVPGRVYRPDAVDASHSFMFHQVEGFLVDTNVTFADLKGTLEFFAKEFFGQDIKMRFRPHFFPFTEPSAEVDISCIICGNRPSSLVPALPAGKPRPSGRCSVCHGKGWLEILGCGMIHPNVFRAVKYDAKKYSGFAFGMGVERIAMLKYGIDDIRLFYENDLRFLEQF